MTDVNPTAENKPEPIEDDTDEVTVPSPAEPTEAAGDPAI